MRPHGRLGWASLALQRQEGGSWRAILPAGAAGQWCQVRVACRAARWWVKVSAMDQARGQVVREMFLGKMRGPAARRWRGTLMHVPASAQGLELLLLGADVAGLGPPALRLRVLSRRGTALRLLAHGWPKLGMVLVGNWLGLAGRARAVLGQAPARAGQAPPYAMWRALYDRWGEAEQRALLRFDGALPAIEIVVLGAASLGAGAALQATLDSLAGQTLAPFRVTLGALPQPHEAAKADWVLLLQAGETLEPHALACFAHAAARAPDAGGFFADAEEAGGTCPLLKPRADPWLLRSGLLTNGACLFRADALPPCPGDAGAWRDKAAWALPDGGFIGIPFVLTHVPRMRCASPALVTGRLGALPFVSIVIPSSARSPHMLRCLRRVVAGTDYAGGLEILLAISSIDPDDRTQSSILSQAAALQPVVVLDLKLAAFNYAEVNNAAARRARGTLLLLLNDDVAPIQRDWLQRMVAATMQDPPADIVGARLLYGNGCVQHAGVVMGLANLCEHAFRLAVRRDGGPFGIGLVARQVSAVTGACMLVRRCLYETLSGMDEAFAVALNDVDLCLRAQAADARVVFDPEVELYHYESLSLGRHYQGSRASLEAVEVRRLRDRWHGVIADDPHYSPQASLEPGREFQPAFPPRLTPLSWIERRADAPD